MPCISTMPIRSCADTEQDEPEDGGQYDVHPGDETRRGDGCPLQACRLQGVPRGKERAERAACKRAVPPERAQARSRGDGEHCDGDREPHRKEREERIELERVLDLNERHAPDRRDEDQDDEREHARTLTARAAVLRG